MRFFEIPTAGGLQLSSPCPEMENEFKDGESIFYFKDGLELADKSNRIIAGEYHLDDIKRKAHHKILYNHNYDPRIQNILNAL